MIGKVSKTIGKIYLINIIHMFKKFLISLGAILIWLCTISSTTSAITVHLPGTSTSTPNVNPWNHKQAEWNLSYLAVISFINDYLRFAVWLVCFLFVIINWYKLIISRWDWKQMKKATNALIWCGIGIAASLLAYTIVDIAISLFS